MTSQQFTEKPAETETTQRKHRTNRRAIKKRGILPSFGDMVLPIVGVAAVGLLILAGRQFFINGMKSAPGITSTRAYSESPAIIAERENVSPQPEPAPKPEIATHEPEKPLQDNNTVLAVAKNEDTLPYMVVPVNNKPAKSNPPSPAKITPAVKSVPIPINKQWRVQTGAYPQKSGAENAAKKIKKAGYKAVVYQNPASKHFKVWVPGGLTKSQAEKVAEEMKKLGYKQSFVFPPMKD
ncbi:MAG: SPOR domain-containing protein [Synergistaceae bacterium]|nr:SPOR domain-containing protein [Synergistaceae bacterium]